MMTQRMALLVAAALTVFVLTVVGSVASRLAPDAAAAPEPLLSTAEAGVTSVMPDQAGAAQGEREAGYQALIRQANERLQQANDQLKEAYAQQQTLASQVDEARGQGDPAEQLQAQSPTSPSYVVSADQAAQIAQAAAPGARLTRQPEMVSFQGSVAYEVTFDEGTMYVDAQSGQILDNGVAANETVGDGRWRDDEHEGEHEGEHGDDD